MRSAGFAVAIALTVGGCSLLFNGNDLKGRNGDMGGGGTGGTGGGDSDMGAAGGGGVGGGGGTGDMAGGPLTTLSFAPAPMSPTGVGAGPYDLTVGDFDGDGTLDAATANDTDNNVSVLIGAGDGHFKTVVNVTVPPTSNGCSPYAISSGRFDADTIDDIVVTCTDLAMANFVYILPGGASHTYSPTAIAALGSTTQTLKPEGITVGDVNKDGKLDLVVANAGVNQVWVLTGNGNGTFASMPVKLAAGMYPTRVTVGDFNGDGRDDVAAADYNDAMLDVYLQNASGVLGTGVPYNTVGDNNDVAARDLNGDGYADLITADSQHDAVAVLLSDKTAPGTFPTGAGTTQPPEFNAHPTPSSVAVADFNRDGKLDLVVANAVSPGGSIDVLLGNGDGTFSAAMSLGNAATPLGVHVGDFNGDGLPDIIFTNNTTMPAVTVLLNTSH